MLIKGCIVNDEGGSLIQNSFNGCPLIGCLRTRVLTESEDSCKRSKDDSCKQDE